MSWLVAAGSVAASLVKPVNETMPPPCVRTQVAMASFSCGENDHELMLGLMRISYWLSHAASIVGFVLTMVATAVPSLFALSHVTNGPVSVFVAALSRVPTSAN